ncbi:glycerate kinase [Paenibacillus sp. GCM10023248]|uniref:glycerate kinase family protein n=1 Tax=unclassified Paenibacillus TaxID=185978 RepID=UPI002379F0C8|nr:glycerate kinase [Paenibacillus sp. MAHUQ-63]MDD9267180.1 glycerate kinase [Paenibacillus sp. MAHUQ-63]
MNVIIAPDSFKGSLSSLEAGTIMKKAILREIPHAAVTVIPIADGGEGTVDTLVAATGGNLFPLTATGPLGERAEVRFGLLPEGTAVLEAASICGLVMVPPAQRNPMHTTSRGIGEVLLAAMDQGHRRFILGLGGSATNDGGLGMLQALGGLFLDANGNPADGFGASLSDIRTVDLAGLDVRLKDCDIQVACDVTSPLCGDSGATYVFGPQKGGTPEHLQVLEAAMQAYAAMVEEQLEQPGLSLQPGAGAAGGLGFAMLALGAKLKPGAKVLAEAVKLPERIAGADWVITGEGRSDDQTLYGKLPIHVAELAQAAGVPALLISGSLGAGSEQLLNHFRATFSIVPGPVTLEACMENAETYLYERVRNIARLLT